MNKGNVLIVVAVLVVASVLGGFYLKSNGGLKYFTNKNATVSLEEKVGTADADIKSPDMTLSASVDKYGVVSGKTNAYAEVFINDQVVKADAMGNFSLKLTDLVVGENVIVVSANDEEGNVSEQNLTINIEE